MEPVDFPLKLNSGEEYTRKFNLTELESQVLNQLSENDWIRLTIKDTFDKKYESKKMKVASLKKYTRSVLKA